MPGKGLPGGLRFLPRTEVLVPATLGACMDKVNVLNPPAGCWCWSLSVCQKTQLRRAVPPGSQMRASRPICKHLSVLQPWGLEPDLFLPLSSFSSPSFLLRSLRGAGGLFAAVTIFESFLLPDLILPHSPGPAPAPPVSAPIRLQMLEITNRPPWLLHLPALSSPPVPVQERAAPHPACAC